MSSALNPLLNAMRFAGGGSTAPPPSSAINGYNLATIGYFNSSRPFLDLMKTGGGFYPTGIGPYDVDNFLPALPAGATAKKDLCLGLDANYGYFPPGNYEAVSTNNVTVGCVANPGISNIVSGVGRCTFTITALPGAWDTLRVTPTVTNNTGSALAVTNLRVNLVSNATAILAGSFFDPAYVNAHRNAKVIRVHDWWGTDDTVFGCAWTRKFTDINQNLSASTWYPVPCSVGMLFAKAVRQISGDARPWINVPCGSGEQFFKVTIATGRVSALVTGSYLDFPSPAIKAHGFAEGEAFRFIQRGSATTTPAGLAPLAENVTYYAKNVTTNDFQVSLTHGGSPVTFTYSGFADALPPSVDYSSMASMNVDPYNDMILPFLTACHTADPTSKPLIEVGGENWNSTFPTNYWLRTIMGLIAGGGSDPAYDLYGAAGHIYLHLLAWKAATSLWGDGNFTMVWPGQGIPGFVNSLTSAFDYVDPTGVRSLGTAVKTQISAALALQGSNPIPPGVYSIGSYMIQTGRWLLDTYEANGNSTAIPDSLWDSKFNAEIADRAVDSTNCIAGIQAIIPGIKMVFYEWGQQVNLIPQFSGTATTIAVAQNLFTYYDTVPGRAMYQRYWAAVVTPHLSNFYAVAHYQAAGGNFNSTAQVLCWCPIPADNTETPRSLWLKTV